MKHTYLTVLLFSTLVTIIFQSYSDGPASNGARATGAPGDGPNRCTTCHTGGSFGTVTAALSLVNGSGDTVTTYVPGESYTATIEVNHSSGSPSGFGFQMLCLKTSNNGNQGGWSNPSSNAKLSTTAARNYVEHNATSSSNTFSVDWTAPLAGTGDVKFYIGANAVNGDGGNGGDKAVLVDFTISEGSDTTDTNDIPEGIRSTPVSNLRVFPNPATHSIVLQGWEEEKFVTLVSALGVTHTRPIESSGRVDISALRAGYYWILDEQHMPSLPFLKMDD